MIKHKKINKQHSKTLGDITLNDFANAEVCKNRQRKSTSNVSSVIKQIESDKGWDEIDESYDFVRELNEDDGTYVVVLRKRSPLGKKSNDNVANGIDNNVPIGNSYPLDIWFLISEYIQPQDVGRFAGICKASHAVVCSAKFWFSLYRRYYKYCSSLPRHLEPEHMVRLYGLRTSVIRALYFMYPPFIDKVKNVSSAERHPGTLINKQCMIAFHKQGFESVYCFKFRENISFKRRTKREPQHQINLIEMLEDVTANPDENCCILLVNCKQCIPIPCVEGLILKSALLTLSQGFRHHRLQLAFSSGIHNYSYNTLDGSNSTSIVFDPVLGVKVIDWWDPQYPYSHTIKYTLAGKDEFDEEESTNCESLFSMF